MSENSHRHSRAKMRQIFRLRTAIRQKYGWSMREARGSEGGCCPKMLISHHLSQSPSIRILWHHLRLFHVVPPPYRCYLQTSFLEFLNSLHLIMPSLAHFPLCLVAFWELVVVVSGSLVNAETVIADLSMGVLSLTVKIDLNWLCLQFYVWCFLASQLPLYNCCMGMIVDFSHLLRLLEPLFSVQFVFLGYVPGRTPLKHVFLLA